MTTRSIGQDLWIGARMLGAMTVLLGFVYPAVVTGLARGIFPAQAEGSLVRKGDAVIGSKLLGQKFEKAVYFWPRPSAPDFNPLASGGSNLGWTSAALRTAVNERRARLMAARPDGSADGPPPSDLLFASGSGLDPHVTIAGARWQVARVAAARKVEPSRIIALVDEAAEGRQLGILGEPRANVLKLNLLLDERFGPP